MKHEGVDAYDVSLVFVGDRAIRSLNRRYLNRNHTTDVLAFDLGGDASGRGTVPFAGEIVISVDTAIRNASAYKTTPHREIFLYIVHGLLHLRGYDDHTPKDTVRMRAKEQKALERLKI